MSGNDRSTRDVRILHQVTLRALSRRQGNTPLPWRLARGGVEVLAPAINGSLSDFIVLAWIR